jgi:hypothetical protein
VTGAACRGDSLLVLESRKKAVERRKGGEKGEKLREN